MKIKISYTESEAAQVAVLVSQLKKMLPVQAKWSDRHEPFYHVYLTLKKRK